MKILRYFESDNQEHWLNELARCDWVAGAFLRKLLINDTFFDTMGKESKVLLLVNGDELISFCTFVEVDDIRPTHLTPWVGFVYTFPEHRGHRYIGLLFDEVERLSKEAQIDFVYLSTNHIGLYEKYGWEYMAQMIDMEGQPTRVYAKPIGGNDGQH